VNNQRYLIAAMAGAIFGLWFTIFRLADNITTLEHVFDNRITVLDDLAIAVYVDGYGHWQRK